MSEKTLLRDLVKEAQWTFQGFSAQFQRAARRVADRDQEPRLARLTVSETTFRRWTSGALRTRPSGDVCRVLEELFQRPAADLFAVAPSVVQRTIAGHDEDVSRLVKEQIAMAARNALRYTSLSPAGVDAETLATLTGEAARLAELYPTAPLHEFLGDLVNLQDISYRLLETRHRPDAERDLNLVAALSTGLLAKASHDQGNPNAAITLARAAYKAADHAGHPGLKAWIRGIQALTAYWAGWKTQAADYAHNAQQASLTGSITAWLPALEARAHAALGDRTSATEALIRAQAARESFEPSDLDGFGGLLTFPEAQQAYYHAETLVLVDPGMPDALRAADLAVAAYSDPDAAHWAFGDEAGSRAHQAVARIATGDLDGGLEAIEPVLALPPQQRTHGISVCVQRTADALPAAGPAAPRLAGQMRAALEEFDHTTLKALTQ
jgi:hypothetical protein